MTRGCIKEGKTARYSDKGPMSESVVTDKNARSAGAAADVELQSVVGYRVVRKSRLMRVRYTRAPGTDFSSSSVCTYLVHILSSWSQNQLNIYLFYSFPTCTRVKPLQAQHVLIGQLDSPKNHNRSEFVTTPSQTYRLRCKNPHFLLQQECKRAGVCTGGTEEPGSR